MATSKPKSETTKSEETALVEASSNAIQLASGTDALIFQADAGLPSDLGQDDYAIPFLTILQKGSPQVDETSGVALEGAKAGMIFENVAGRMVDGRKGVLFVPVAYRHVFVRWGPRSGDGAGFKGEISVDAAAILRDRNEVRELDGRLYFPMPDGSVNEKKSDRLVDTRNWYVFVLDETTGAWTTALLSLASTQIKKSKMLMSMLQSVRAKTADGTMVRTAMFYNVVRMTTVAESNDKGSWYGASFKLEGNTAGNRALHEEAVAFATSVRSGAVAAKYEDAAGGGDSARNGDDGAF